MLPYLGHQALFGAIAAAGFGVLFNFGGRALIWCAVAGALALAVRTFGQQCGGSLEAASFLAAAVTSCAAILSRRWLGVACHAIALAGCIPMVPGAFFGQALLGFMWVAGASTDHTVPAIVGSVQAFVRVISTVGAIGAGLTIPAYLLRSRQF
ncbi:threonine/serine exporter family protein [Rhodopseudomonas rhenobacensis]|nr:threonine/serine exporter family protein [Rhodopseudomonas rhenobacensis]